MDLKTIGTLLELVQNCYQKVLAAQTDYNSYRRMAGEHGIPTPDRHEFASLACALNDAAKELDRRRNAVQNAVYGVGILQADIVSPDGKRKRTAVVCRPTDKIHEPYVTWAAYHALCAILGGKPLTTTAPFDIAVLDDFGRVSEHRITTTNQ